MRFVQGVLYLSDDTMEQVQKQYQAGKNFVAILREDIVEKHELNLDEIEAIRFHPQYFYLSSQLILSLPKLRLAMGKSLV